MGLIIEKLHNRLKSIIFELSPKYKDIRERRYFFVRAPFMAAGNLLKKIHIKEDEYHNMVETCRKNPREYYIYGIIDEIIKAGSSAMRWEEFLKTTDSPDIAMNIHEGRLVCEAVIDEQNMWMRKLSEILVDEIIFSKCNNEHFYRGYLTAIALDNDLAIQKDINEFYNSKNDSLQQSINKGLKTLSAIEYKTKRKPLPHLASIVSMGSMPSPGKVFLSFRRRLLKAFEIASDNERLALNITYGIGYGRWSRSLHGKVYGPIRTKSVNPIDTLLGHVAIISFNILHRAHELLGLDPSGINKQISDYLRYTSNAPELIKLHEKDYQIGDLAITNDGLGQILEFTTSKYGYKAYKIEYLSHLDSRKIREDWFPAIDIERIAKRKDAKLFWKKNLEKSELGKQIWVKIKDMSDDKCFEMLKSFLSDLANANVLKHILKSNRP